MHDGDTFTLFNVTPGGSFSTVPTFADAARPNTNPRAAGAAEESVTLNFVNAEIESVIKAVSLIT